MPRNYISFLLRLWKTDSQGGTAWRVMLENPHTRAIRGFDSLEDFYSYLQKMAVDDLVDPNDQDQFAGYQ